MYVCVCVCGKENDDITCKKLSKKKPSNIQLNFETKRIL